MNLSEPFIRRPVMTLLLMLAIVGMGISSFRQLGVSDMPNVDYPTINVKVSYPGSAPEIMANNVATPLEKEFMTIAGIDTITSVNTIGNTSITLKFKVDVSMVEAAQDVEAAISRARLNLPPDLPNPPTYKKVNPSDTPVMYIAMTSSIMPIDQLYTYGNSIIGQQLAKVEGVAQVLVYGSPYAVRIQVNPNTLATLNLSLQDVATSIASGNPILPSGQIDGKTNAQTIYTHGQLTSAAQYLPLVIAYRDGAPVRIQDVGTTVDSTQNDRIHERYISKDINEPTVVLAIQRQPGSNAVELSNAIKAELPGLLEKLPSSANLRILFDRSDSIKESVFDVEMTLIIAFLLVVLVVFLYLGKLRDTIIPTLVLPISLCGTFIGMHWLNYTLDNLSLLALTLAIGFIIDDAIVVIENIVRHVDEGKTPLEASLIGSKEISFTLLSITASLIAVFVPMIFMAGLIGKVFREFAMTLSIVTAGSAAVAIILTPMLCSRFLKKNDGGETKLSRFSTKLNQSMLNWYEPKLRWMLEHRVVALVLSGICLIVTLLLFFHLPQDFLPDDDIGFVIVYSQAKPGTSSDQMNDYSQQIQKILYADDNIESFISISSNPTYRDGITFLRLKPFDERPPINQIIQNLYKKLSVIAGVNIFIKNVPSIDLTLGENNKGAYQYVIQGLNNQDLYNAAGRFYDRMRQEDIFQGVSTDVENKNPQINVEIMRDQASSYGITAADIEQALLYAYSGNRVSRIYSPIDEYDVILEITREEQRHASSLSKIYVRSSITGSLVPLSAIVKFEEGLGYASVNHVLQFPAATISFNLRPGVPLGIAIEKINEMARDIFSIGVYGEIKGAGEVFLNSIRSTGILFILAIFAMYIILGILYESFIHPITILSTLPPATMGGLITLWLLGMPLSLYAFMGLILLIGLVKKNGIIMIDYALDNIRERHETPENSIYGACLVRFRPIMMTTVAAVMGALPIALGVGASAQARRPLGLVIIGGLVISQMLTLFITPVIYLYLQKLNEKLSFSPLEDSVKKGAHSSEVRM